MLYEQVAQHYLWGHLLPLPAGVKHPPPVGYTGHEGRPVTEAERAAWAQHRGNYALRLPDGVVGLDVDQYDQKRGMDTITALEGQLGPLPPTWVSTGRGYESGSGIRFYRYPGGRLAGQVGESVEAIQHGHRYAVVWPSVAGPRQYAWWAPNGAPADHIPTLGELPELPAAWVNHLRSGASQYSGTAAPDSARDSLLAAMFADPRPTCVETHSATRTAILRLDAAGEGGRHDAVNASVLRLVASAAEGHAGLARALAELAGAWDEAVGHDPARAGEFERMVQTAAAKVATVHPTPVTACTCEQLAQLNAKALTPAVPGSAYPPELGVAEEAPVAVAAPAIFDPLHAYTDRDLSDAVGLHMAQRAGFAMDADAWLYRTGDGTWALVGGTSASEGAKAVVQLCGRTHPRGDAKGEPEDVARAGRYKRLTSSAGIGGVAALLVNTSRMGAPWAFRLADMDTDPTILWAGGRAYDLTRSAESPVLADIDPLTPHLVSAPVVPDLGCPTPLWDEFLEVVLPDPEHRAWVLRVFGVAVTGESHRVLGIMHGPRGSGKTSILSLVSSALGSYAASPPASILDAKTSSQVDEFRLIGKRLAWVDEGPRTGRWATERLKALTGGAAMTARDLYKSPVTWQPTHTLFLTSNDQPQVTDDALRDRVRSVHMTTPKADVARIMARIGGVNSKAWRAELPGVLAQLMREGAGYLADRSSAANPVAVETELEAMAREQDPVTVWLDDRTTEGETRASDLFADFRDYAARVGFRPDYTPNMTGWGRRLTELGYPAKHGRDGKSRPLAIRGGNGGQLGWGPGQAPVQAPLEAPAQAPDGPPEVPAWTPQNTPETGRDQFGAGGVPTGHTEAVAQSTGTRSSMPISVSSMPSGARDQFRDQLVTGSEANWSQVKAIVSAAINPPCDQLTTFSRETRREEKKGEERKKIERRSLEPQTGHKLPAVKVRGGVPQAVELTTAADLLGTLSGQSLTLDCETSGFPYGHPLYKLRTMQLGTQAWVVVLAADNPEHVALAADAMNRAGELVAHSATADVSLVALAAGVDSAPWWDKTTDTAVLAALADPELTGLHRKRDGALALEALSAELLPEPYKPHTDKARGALFRSHKWLSNTTPTTPLERNGWAMVDPGDPVMLDYAASDVLDTAELRAVLPEPSAQVMHRERRTQKIMARLPERGLRLDPERVRTATAEQEALQAPITAKLACYGITDPARTEQVGAVLTAMGAVLPLTAKSKKTSTAAAEIEKLAATPGPAQQAARDLLDWREHEKILSTYLRPFAIQALDGDGRSYPTILTLGAAATGRMSSVRPNIQQVPRPSYEQTLPGGGGGIRGCFLADPGQLFISADFSSVEVRIAAAVTGDATLAHMVREGIDLHGEITKLARGLTPDDPGFKDARSAIKGAVFGYLYGAGLTTMAAQLGGSMDLAVRVVDALRSITPQLMAWDKQLRAAVTAGTMRTWTHPSGRVAYFNQDRPHKSLNTVVQGFGRELLVDAVLKWEDMHPGCSMIPLHDELVIAVPEDKAEAWTADLAACMTTTLPTPDGLGVPIVCEPDPPTSRWGTTENHVIDSPT